MKTTVVSYQAKPERADENQRLIEQVFVELEEAYWTASPTRSSGSKTESRFIHVVIEHRPMIPIHCKQCRLLKPLWPGYPSDATFHPWPWVQQSSVATADHAYPDPRSNLRECPSAAGRWETPVAWATLATSASVRHAPSPKAGSTIPVGGHPLSVAADRKGAPADG